MLQLMLLQSGCCSVMAIGCMAQVQLKLDMCSPLYCRSQSEGDLHRATCSNRARSAQTALAVALVSSSSLEICCRLETEDTIDNGVTCNSQVWACEVPRGGHRSEHAPQYPGGDHLVRSDK